MVDNIVSHFRERKQRAATFVHQVKCRRRSLMSVKRRLGFTCAILLANTANIAAQSYPSRPVRMVVGGVGGGNDFVARLVAPGLSEAFKHPFIVENRPSGVIPGEVVSRSTPDGHTLLVTGTTFWLLPFLQASVPYDPVADFAPVSLMASAPNILVVHPTLPVKSMKELIALARRRSGELNYSSGASGTSAHLAAELFKSMAGVNIVRIPYKSGAAEMADLVGGHVQLTFGNAAPLMPHIKANRLKALAVTSLQPSALLPGLPTISNSGLHGFETTQVSGIFVPGRTPDVVIRQLNKEIVQFIRTPGSREKLLNSGVEAMGSTPEEFAARIKEEIVRMGKLITNLGIRAD